MVSHLQTTQRYCFLSFDSKVGGKKSRADALIYLSTNGTVGVDVFNGLQSEN